MSAENPEIDQKWFWIGGAGAVIVGLLAVLFLLGQGDSNGKPAEQARNPSLEVLAAAAQGTVENFLVTDPPKELTDVSFFDGEGQEKRLSDWKGRLVLLNLWATWCAPCREEMPALDRLQAALGDEHFEVVALSVDSRDTDLPKAFYEEIGISSLSFYHDPTARAGSRLAAFGMPTTLLIGPDGRELGRLAGPAEWDHPEAQNLIQQARKSFMSAK